MLWRDGVFHYRGPQNRPLNLSIVCSAGPCYFSAKSSWEGRTKGFVLPSQSPVQG
jgi:hypothetical protein